VLPGAERPNAPGTVVLPPDLRRPPATPAVRTPDELARLWRAAGATYRIPWPVLGAINSIESGFGRNMGPSSAGALGWMQFMPSTWERWGLDADGDGTASPWSPEDAVYSAARYLAAAGAERDLPRAVFAYNHAWWYVEQVLRLAAVYEQGGSELAFGLDRLAARLAAARADLAAASADLDAARTERSLARREGRALRSRSQRVAALVARVAGARRTVDELSAAAAGATFSPATAVALGGPALSGGRAFPVGGGPATVSVGAAHHDYPAVDIAAPAGAPVYAFDAGVVEKAWAAPQGRCGIGFVLRTADGRGWVHCHLSVLEAGTRAGARVNAGTLLGLVGSTGASTGPHLHLQLERAEAWPQRELWFAAFAGIAFRWQDAPPVATQAGSPFAVVGGPVDVVLFRP
jgi:murein DD-endopeptidase MepM/ murein hydrolase activator NlpD